MHGMLSLAVLVAAFAGLAGWAVLVSVRLYRACSAAQARQARPPVRSADDTDNGGEQAAPLIW
ncbi:MAG TPA: hypothetical protein VGI74_27655 [Streptosporangiaceae bacterium]|jgi:hypothetical protein